jgi:hypothetical protein
MRLRARHAIPLLCALFMTSLAACSQRGGMNLVDAGEEPDLTEENAGDDLAMAKPDLAMLDRGSCLAVCTGCKSGEACLSTDATLGTCLRTCTVNADCPTNWTCARVVTNWWTHQSTGAPLAISQAVCINADNFQPSVCPSLPRDLHCDVSAMCYGQSLLTPVPVPGACGWTPTLCARGCNGGGGGTPAHCN